MMSVRPLAEVIDSLDTLDDDLEIYALTDFPWTWTPDSPAVLCYDPEWEDEYEDERGYPRDKTHLMSVPEAEAAGMAYVEQVGIAKEVLEVWSTWREGRYPTRQDKYEAVIHYATHDAYLPLADE